MFLITMRNADGTQFYSEGHWHSDSEEAQRFINRDDAESRVIGIRSAPTYGFGDYGIHNARVVEDRPRIIPVTRQVDEEEDDGYGGAFTIYTVARVQRWLTDDQVTELVEEYAPGSRCQHDYDCCGNYYGARSIWTPADNWHGYSAVSAFQTILIKQDWSQNV